MSTQQDNVKRASSCLAIDNVIALESVPQYGGTRTPKYKAWWSLGERLDCYEREIRARGLSDKTVEGVLWALGNMLRALWQNGYDANPRRIGQTEVDYLTGVHYAGRSQSYIAHNLSMLKQFLKWAGNKQIEAIRWPVRTWARPNADWLDDDVAIAARAAAEGIERILVNLELDLGLRRVEVLRLHVSDFHSGRLSSVHVLGKGRHGGKPRDVHWHPDTPAELEGYLKIRDAVVVKARAKNPGAEDPGNLLVYERGGQILAYKKSALDNFAKRLARRVGKDFSHHTLRRTCGRMMSRAKVNIENIAAVFGHSDTKTTLRYLGLDLEDQRSTMLKYARYQEAVKTVKIPEIGISDESQEKDGPCGI